MHDKMIKAITGIAACLWPISASALEAHSPLPYIILILSTTWLTLVWMANTGDVKQEKEEQNYDNHKYFDSARTGHDAQG